MVSVAVCRVADNLAQKVKKPGNRVFEPLARFLVSVIGQMDTHRFNFSMAGL